MTDKEKRKKYRKNPSKLFQVRLSQKEYEEVIEYFNNLDITRRSWIISKVKLKQNV